MMGRDAHSVIGGTLMATAAATLLAASAGSGARGGPVGVDPALVRSLAAEHRRALSRIAELELEVDNLRRQTRALRLRCAAADSA